MLINHNYNFHICCACAPKNHTSDLLDLPHEIRNTSVCREFLLINKTFLISHNFWTAAHREFLVRGVCPIRTIYRTIDEETPISDLQSQSLIKVTLEEKTVQCMRSANAHYLHMTTYFNRIWVKIVSMLSEIRGSYFSSVQEQID